MKAAARIIRWLLTVALILAVWSEAGVWTAIAIGLISVRLEFDSETRRRATP